jgi:hypothetical protein
LAESIASTNLLGRHKEDLLGRALWLVSDHRVRTASEGHEQQYNDTNCAVRSISHFAVSFHIRASRHGVVGPPVPLGFSKAPATPATNNKTEFDDSGVPPFANDPLPAVCPKWARQMAYHRGHLIVRRLCCRLSKKTPKSTRFDKLGVKRRGKSGLDRVTWFSRAPLPLS